MDRGEIRCDFKEKYYNYASGRNDKFECLELATSSGRCIFHDSSYYLEHADEVLNLLLQKINDSISQIEPLYCIGYHIPNLQNNFRFTATISFEKSHFHGRTDFSKSEFQEEANFSSVRFGEDISFFGVTFRSKAAFSGESFGQMLFTQSKFYDEAYFIGKFHGENHFIFCEFNGPTTFSGDFNGGVDFYGTIFLQTAQFSGSFRGGWFAIKIRREGNLRTDRNNQTSFYGVQFRGPVYFQHVTFLEGANFGRSHFLRDAEFKETVFQSETSFDFTYFGMQEQVLFDVENLSKVSFTNADITRVRFGEKILWGEDNKFKIMDEERLEWSLTYLFKWNDIPKKKSDVERIKIFLKWLGLEWAEDAKVEKENESTITVKNTTAENIVAVTLSEDKSSAQLRAGDTVFYEFEASPSKDNIEISIKRVDMETVRAIYRNLRENYEYRLRYDEAGGFFVREMELKRYYKATSEGLEREGRINRNFSPIGLYFHLSTYGENARKPIIGLVTIFIISLSAWFIFSPHIYEAVLQPDFGEDTEGYQLDIVGGIRYGFERTMLNLFQVNGESIWFDFIVRAGFALELGLLLIALRRRLERRFRH